jgi:hypothetical protein
LEKKGKEQISGGCTFPISHPFRWHIGKVGAQGPPNDAFAGFNIRARLRVNNSGQTGSSRLSSNRQTQYRILLDAQLYCSVECK